MKIDSKEFEKAYQLISSLLPATPLVKNDWLSRKYEANVFLKLESLQPVGSFKLRGAANKIFNLSDEEKKQFNYSIKTVQELFNVAKKIDSDLK